MTLRDQQAMLQVIEEEIERRKHDANVIEYHE